MKIPHITCVEDFIQEIKKVHPGSNCTNYFRGHSQIHDELKPSIYRDGYIENEDKIFKETIMRVPYEFSHYKTTIEKLVKMQHYGVPTRLLDITSNPLVALFFACKDSHDKDGEVIFLQVPNESIKFYDSDTVSILANLSKRPLKFEIQYDEDTEIPEFNECSEIKLLLHEIKEEKSYFQNIINPKDLEKVFAVRVKLDNDRILKQSGAFLLFGVRSNKKSQANVPYEWILNITQKKKLDLRIPANKKKEILNELDLLGFSSSTLFPELENQAEYLRNSFKKQASIIESLLSEN